jgi:hypothetical protein
MTYKPPTYGEIYIDTGTTTQTTNGSADTFDVMTGWNETEGADGISAGTTPAKASNKHTQPDQEMT